MASQSKRTLVLIEPEYLQNTSLPNLPSHRTPYVQLRHHPIGITVAAMGISVVALSGGNAINTCFPEYFQMQSSCAADLTLGQLRGKLSPARWKDASHNECPAPGRLSEATSVGCRQQKKQSSHGRICSEPISRCRQCFVRGLATGWRLIIL